MSAVTDSEMDSSEFFDLVDGFFGQHATDTAYARARKVYTCVLYETFQVRCGLDGEHGEFGAGIEYAPGLFNTTFFGRQLSLNRDRSSVLQSLQTIDDWCRLHLPDKFLKRYDDALAQGTDDFQGGRLYRSTSEA